MKKSISLLLMLFVLLSFAQAQQLEKTEKKALKKEIRGHKKDLTGYKKQKEETAETIRSQQDTIQALKSRMAAENARARAKEAEMSAQIAHLEEMMKNCTGEAPRGDAFKVQIGFYKQSEIIKTLTQRKFVIEEDEGGKKYLIGFFKSADEALQFRDDIKKMGVKDAFVVKYKDGQRTKEEVKRPWE
jgi:hypothetical protein